MARGMTAVPTKSLPKVKRELSALRNTLIKLRKELGVSQEQLAELADVGSETVRSIEQGKRIPSLPTLICLCDQLGVELKLAKK